MASRSAIESPTRIAGQIIALAERIAPDTDVDTKASRQRKGIVAVLETMLSMLEAMLRDCVYKEQRPRGAELNEASICKISEMFFFILARKAFIFGSSAIITTSTLFA